MSDRPQLTSLLKKWATLEPQRCRQRNQTSFEVLYQGDWYSVADYPGSHGMLVAAILDSCEINQLYCQIEYSPHTPHQPPQLNVTCQPKTFQQQEGDRLTPQLPNLLLIEYLEKLAPKQQP